MLASGTAVSQFSMTGRKQYHGKTAQARHQKSVPGAVTGREGQNVA